MTRIVLIAVVAFVATFSTTQADAQQTYRPFKQLNRWLGHFHNHGYHYQNPGPDVSYYNPYNAHNSQRVAQFNPNGFNGRRGIGFQQRGFGYQQQYQNMGMPSSYNQPPMPIVPVVPVQEGSGTRNLDDIPEPNARSVESAIEGEVESFDIDGATNGTTNDSLTPGDGSGYDSYWDEEDKTSSLLRTSAPAQYGSSFRPGGSSRK